MADYWTRMPLLELSAVGFAALYLVLAIRQNVWCWPAGLISALLSILLFSRAQLFMEALLQAFYAIMAIYGWVVWARGIRGKELPVRTWRWRNHVLALALILVVSGLCAWALSYTSQVMPFVDSFTTVASIVTTFMVAHKILENWLYWFVIDSVSIYMYLVRDLPFYALLFVVYLVLIVVGYRRWRGAHIAQLHAANAC